MENKTVIIAGTSSGYGKAIANECGVYAFNNFCPLKIYCHII
ncbi:MAG: hypothetical protein ABI091_00445 [Ferruginibacter sp.]